MGRRKPFIDKRNATTYSLLYGDEDQQPQASNQEQSKDAIPPQMGRGFFPFPPEEVTWDLSENKRKEIVELGLPDDGYDYLQHLKDPAANVSSSDNASAPAAEGELLCKPTSVVLALFFRKGHKVKTRAVFRSQSVSASALCGASTRGRKVCGRPHATTADSDS